MNGFTSRRKNSPGRPKGYDPDWRPQKKTRDLLKQVEAVLDEYWQHLPLTARQIFYRMVGAYDYPKNERAYERLCYYLGRARRARLIPFWMLRDDGASVMPPSITTERKTFTPTSGAKPRATHRTNSPGRALTYGCIARRPG